MQFICLIFRILRLEMCRNEEKGNKNMKERNWREKKIDYGLVIREQKGKEVTCFCIFIWLYLNYKHKCFSESQ